MQINRPTINEVPFTNVPSRHNPTTLKDLLALKQEFPNAKIVAGNTEVGIEQRFGKLE